jgi:catechol 2,3-dioxygenase-like lactoylglutathione lyase family enzyme
MTSPPPLHGLHHLKLPVSDLDTSLGWYEAVLGATHVKQFDHYDNDGVRYAAIVALPGVPTPLELRWAPQAAGVMRECDPVMLAVETRGQLDAWAERFDDLGADHSPVLEGAAGHLLVVADPDGIFIRFGDLPPGGLADITMPTGNPEPDDRWLNPPPMQHPRRAAR